MQPGGATVGAPPSFEPLPLAPGQWSRYKMTDDKGQPSFLTYKILSEESGAYWIETLHESYFGRTAAGERHRPGRPLRGLLPRSQRRAVGTVEEHG
jgi:hypothetical protein